MYLCPKCAAPWQHRLVWRHSTWSPIKCPRCKGRFTYKRSRWYLITAPLILVVSAWMFTDFRAHTLLGYEVPGLPRMFFWLLIVAAAVWAIGMVKFLRFVYLKPPPDGYPD